jgi:transposase
MQDEHSRKRRRYSRELKTQILAECAAPGTSVARVAMAYGINANIVHGWRKLARGGGPAPLAASQLFVPVKLAAPAVPSPSPSPTPAPIVVELQRGPMTMRVTWPSTAGADFAAWTRDLLR